MLGLAMIGALVVLVVLGFGLYSGLTKYEEAKKKLKEIKQEENINDN